MAIGSTAPSPDRPYMGRREEGTTMKLVEYDPREDMWDSYEAEPYENDQLDDSFDYWFVPGRGYAVTEGNNKVTDFYTIGDDLMEDYGNE